MSAPVPLWVTVIVSIGVPGLLSLALGSWITRKRLGAETDKLGTEATEILTNAAGGLVERIDQDNTRLRADVLRLSAELHACQARQRTLETHVREWGTWADQMTAALRRGDKAFKKPRPRLPVA